MGKIVKSRTEVNVGDKIDSYGCGEFIVLNRTGNFATIQFNTGYLLTTSIDCVVDGYVKDPLYPNVHGVGCLGVGKYTSRDLETSKITREYRCWSNMIERCYIKRQKWYEDVSVDSYWHNFQNFAKWYSDKIKIFDEFGIEDVDLDKDIFAVKGEPKRYSEDTCCLIPRKINRALIHISKEKSGVLKRKYGYSVTIKNKIIATRLLSEEQAILVYRRAKQNLLTDLANTYKSVIDEIVYDKLCNWYEQEETEV